MKDKFCALFERNCKECGKLIFPTPQWAYRIDKDFYCSYKCWRKNGGRKWS